MGLVNRRNAVLGWTVWQVGKRAAKRKARDAVPGRTGEKRAGKGAIVSALAAVGGALWFWRRRRSNGESAD